MSFEQDIERRAGASSNRMLLRSVILLAFAIVVLTGLVTVTIVRLVDEAASQQQLGTVQADSCHVFSFVADRFLVPTKTETPAQKKVTAQFAAELHHAVADCVKAGYAP